MEALLLADSCEGDASALRAEHRSDLLSLLYHSHAQHFQYTIPAGQTPLFNESTLCGELVDSAIFYVVAFYGIWKPEQLLQVTLTQYVLKSGWEIVATPLTYKVVNFLKRAEQEDFYDTTTNFTPFSLKTS
jgi:hypothetical protein